MDKEFELLLEAEMKRSRNEDWIKNNLDDATQLYMVYLESFNEFVATIEIITDEQLLNLKRN